MTGFQLLPPLSESEYDALREDIKAHGVLSTVDIDERGVILDGHHRQQIATELGITCPKRVVRGLHNDTSKRTYALTVNTNRRHLTAEQRRHLTETSLREDPQLTDREHARRIGVSPTTVGTARERLQASGQLPRTETRTDPRGHQHKTPTPPKPPTPTVQLDSSDGDTTATEIAPATDATPDPTPAATPLGPIDAAPFGPVNNAEPDETVAPEPIRPTPARATGELSDDPDVVNEESALRSSHTFAASLAGLWMVIDPDPVGWISRRYRPNTYPQRDLPRVRDVFTTDGLRTLADHLNDIADHLESKGVSL